MEASPLNKAHHWASVADRLSAKGPSAYREAYEARKTAAQEFETASLRTQDAIAAQSLKLLATTQRNRAEDLKRTIKNELSRKGSVPVKESRSKSREGSSSNSNRLSSATAQYLHSAPHSPFSHAHPPSHFQTNSHHSQHRDSRHGQLGPRAKVSRPLASPSGVPSIAVPPVTAPSIADTKHLRPTTPKAPFLSANSPESLSIISTANPAASMVDSRISRRSDSPSSQSTSATMFEDSFMVLRNDNESADPFTQFYNFIEERLQQVTNPVAFATAPLGRPSVTYSESPSTYHSAANTPSTSTYPFREENEASHAEYDEDGEEAFYVVPRTFVSTSLSSSSSNNNSKSLSSSSPILKSSTSTVQDSSESSPSTTKVSQQKHERTNEELKLENSTLKATLDSLTQEFEQEKREKSRMQDSIAEFGRDVRKEFGGMFNVTLKEMEKEIATLKTQLEEEQAEKKKWVALGDKYKQRYETLRDAIRKKRNAKEKETAAAAAINNNASMTTSNTKGINQTSADSSQQQSTASSPIKESAENTP